MAADTDIGSIISTPIFVVADEAGDVIQMQRTTPVVATQTASFALTSSKDPVSASDTFSYEVNLGNSSNTAISNAHISLQLPPGVSVNSVSDSGTQTGSSVVWDVASLATGAFVTRSVNVTVNNSAVKASSFVAVAELNHTGGLELDRRVTSVNTVNTSFLTQSVTVNSSATSGSNVSMTISLVNTSINSIMNNVNIEYILPKGITLNRSTDLTPASTSQTGCDYTTNCAAKDEVFWTFAQIAPGETVTITATLGVEATVPAGSILNHTVFVTSDDSDDTVLLNKPTLISAP